MAPVMPLEPQSAADYDDRTTTAVKAVLVEIGQILGSFRGKFAVVGGVVPWLLLDNDSMRHVGTLDVDLSLNAEALCGGEYAKLIEALMGNGYQQRQDLRRFQLLREVPATDGGGPIDIVIDFLMPRGAIVEKNIPALIGEFAVQRASGAELAMNFYKLVAVEGPMPEGGTNRVEIAVASIPALLAMKGFAIRDRHKQKDAYDIYYCVRNYPGGISALPCSRCGRAVMAIEPWPTNSTTSTATDLPACGASWKIRSCSASAPPINGSRMLSARSMLGSER